MGVKGRKIQGERDLIGFCDRLYEEGKKNTPIYSLMEAIESPTVIEKAIHNIKSNKGSLTAGIDGKDINNYLQKDYEVLIKEIQYELNNYKPEAVRRVYIDKANGKKRPLGIPIIKDRIIQECIRIILEPIFEGKFFDYSYGFRPYRSTEHAIARIVQIINAKKYVVIEGDIKGYFDNINHNLLIQMLWNNGIKDKRLIGLIKKILKSGVYENGKVKSTTKGTPQGGIISPLLANIYLNNFDHMISDMWETHEAVVWRERTRNGRTFMERDYAPLRNKTNAYHESTHLVRYADDWVILCETKEYAEKLLTKLDKYFKNVLKLELSKEKTLITDVREEKIKFLGFDIYADKKRLDSKLVAKVEPNKEKLNEAIKEINKAIRVYRKTPTLLGRVTKIEQINSKIVGLSNYYKIGISKRSFKKIDRVLFRPIHTAMRKLYKNYTKQICMCKELDNRINRHADYSTKTYYEEYEGKKIGFTRASFTKVEYARVFPPKMCPYTPEGREMYEKKSNKKKLHLQDIWCTENNFWRYTDTFNNKLHNFEYYMNRSYTIKRDKGKCKCCGKIVKPNDVAIHHVRKDLPRNEVNKVKNLVTLCYECHRAVHYDVQVMNVKVEKKILKYKEKLISG